MTFFKNIFKRYGFILLLLGSIGTGINLYMTSGNRKIDIYPPIININDNKKVPGTTYSQKFTASNLTLISQTTSDEILKNALLQRMYPNYRKKFDYNQNQIFTGSKAFSLNGKEYKTKSDNKKLFILDKNKKSDTDAFKASCVEALNTEYTSSTDKDGKPVEGHEYYKLKEWCTVPTIKAVLARHKLHLLNTDDNKTGDDEKWKVVIGGGWFGNTYKDKQSFIPQNELSDFLGSKSNSGISTKTDVEDSHVKALKKKCKEILEKPFERNIFPAPKSFIDEAEDTSKFTKVDEFQEAALFCSESKTAKDYVDQAMHGILRTSLPTTDSEIKDDFCLISNKTISDYENAKTNEPFEGKSFWCAVRILYEKHKGH